MNRKLRLIVLLFSLIAIVGLILIAVYFIENYIVKCHYMNMLISEHRDNDVTVYMFYLRKYFFSSIISLLSILLISFFNYLLWFKSIIKPLTLSELAENKRIHQERKKARLQEKLNKIK